MVKGNVNRVPPEGGWGWMVLVALALGNIFALPTMQFFALLFYEITKELNMSMVDIGTILVLNTSTGMILNAFVKNILDRFSPRKVAFAGALLISFGFVTTSFANSYTKLVISYSLMLAIGMKLYLSACLYVTDQYFIIRTELAHKVAMISIGVGFIVIPMVKYTLLEILQFSSRETLLVMGGLSLHTIAGAALLQPVKKHSLVVSPDPVEMTDMTDKKTFMNGNGRSQSFIMRNGTEAILVTSENNNENYTVKTNNLKSEIINNEKEMYQVIPLLETDNIKEDNTGKQAVQKSQIGSNRRNVYSELLTSPRFIALALGVTLNAVAETIFGVFLAFMLFLYDFPLFDIAISISFFAGLLITTKYIGTFYKGKYMPPAKITAILSIILLIGARIGIAMGFMNCFLNVMIAAGSIGAGKGLLQAKVEVIVPESIREDQEDAANVIQSLANACGLLIGGPLLGYFKDVTGRFGLTMFSINVMNSAVIVIWTAELMISLMIEWIKLKQTSKNQPAEIV